MKLWLLILGGGIITYIIRLSFILLLERISMPTLIQRALRFVPIAVFSALVFPMVFIQEERVILSPLNPRLISACLAALVAWRTHNIVLTILAGMLALFLIQALF
jgi:branched-subunit amino acid transport protein